MSYSKAVKDNPFPAQPTLSPPTGDIFAPYYQYWIQKCFTSLRPVSFEENFIHIQNLFINQPQYFAVYSGLHQNRKDDILHFSVEIKQKFLTIRLHFNGYWRNDFMITDITYHRNYNKEWSNIETIAKYTYDDADDTGSEGSK
jgi:hypothetical protein